MIHGLLWLPLLMAFILIAALGWLERRRQNLYLIWDKGSELVVVQFWDRDEFINGYPKIGNYLIQKVKFG